MKDIRFEALLHAARPDNAKSNPDFTDKVMSAIAKPEIFSAQLRNMSVNKKETLFMKFKHLPKLAIMAIAVGALLVVSGGAYAAYQLLWPKPEVHVSEPTTSVSGREEVAISLAQCGDSDLGLRYELKKNATISIEDVPNVIKARCELDTIGTWAKKTFLPENYRMPFYEDREYDELNINVAMATHLKARTDTSLTFEGLTKYNQTDVTMDTSESVRYIANGTDVKAETIREGDAVVYVVKEKQHMVPQNCTPQHCSIQPTESSKMLVAVVKLSMPFEYYDQLAWQSLAERQACIGNPDDSCLTGYVSGLEVFTGNTAPSINESKIMKTIQGVVTEQNGVSTTIRSSSGKLFTVVNTSNVISTFNNGRAAQYGWPTVKIGSTLDITYVESTEAHSTTISEGQLQSLMLRTEIVSKGNHPNAY